MSFWNTSSGENVAETATTEYDAGGGGFELIPDGSTVLAYSEEAFWEQKDTGKMERYIKIKWKVQKPEGVEGRVVFQKLWVKDHDPQAKPEKAEAKREKALRMLATIDANAGGRLAKRGTEPSDDDLALALVNKPMAITVKVWEIDGAQGKIDGNWIAAVHPKNHELKLGEAKAKAKAAPAGNFGDDLDDDILF